MTRGAGQDLGACAAVDACVSVFCASESGVKVWLLSKSVTTLSRHWPREVPEDSAGVLRSALWWWCPSGWETQGEHNPSGPAHSCLTGAARRAEHL